MGANLKIGVAVVGIFVAGGVTGAMLATRQTTEQRREAPSGGPDQFGPNQMRRFVEQLELTPEQSERIRPLVDHTADEIRVLRRDAFRSTNEMMERMHANVSRELTDEQRAKLLVLQAEHADRARRWFEERQRREEIRRLERGDENREGRGPDGRGPEAGGNGRGRPPPPEGAPPPDGVVPPPTR